MIRVDDKIYCSFLVNNPFETDVPMKAYKRAKHSVGSPHLNRIRAHSHTSFDERNKNTSSDILNTVLLTCRSRIKKIDKRATI